MQKKSVLSPLQRTTYLGVVWDSTTMQARLSPVRIESILTTVRRVREGLSLTVKQFQILLGLMAAASNVIPFGLLYMRPQQWWRSLGGTRVTYVTWDVPLREHRAASQGHTSGISTRAMLHSWKLAPAAHHVLLSILVMTSPAPDVWPSILTDYTYDSELDIADGVPRSVSFPLGTRVTYVTWDVN